MNIGFIALTDAASIIMAKELGYFEKYGIDATVTKQANWAALRDGLQTGQIDAAHALYTLPFSVATKIGGNGNTDLKIAMILNNNGQGITLAKEFAEVGYGDTHQGQGAVRIGVSTGAGDDLPRRHTRPVAALLAG